MLHRDEQRTVIRSQANAAEFAASRSLKEKLRAGSILAIGLADVDAVCSVGRFSGSVRCHPEAAAAVEGGVVGAGNPAVAGDFFVTGGVAVLTLRVATSQEHIPLKRVSSVVEARFCFLRDQLQDVAVVVVWPRIRCVGLGG